MKSAEDIVRKLAARARLERPPRVDVADRVLARLRARESQEAAPARPLAWVAAFSAAVAVPLGLLAIAMWNTLTSPLFGIFMNGPWGIL